MNVQFINKENTRKALIALVATLATAAVFHLTLVSIMAIYKHSLAYLNPLDFLGVSILLPQYRDSRTAAGLGWLTLVILFFCILYIGARYHIYVALIRDSKVGSYLQILTGGNSQKTTMPVNAKPIEKAKKHKPVGPKARKPRTRSSK